MFRLNPVAWPTETNPFALGQELHPYEVLSESRTYRVLLSILYFRCTGFTPGELMLTDLLLSVLYRLLRGTL